MKPWFRYPQVDQRQLEILYSQHHRDYHGIKHPEYVYYYSQELWEQYAKNTTNVDPTMFFADAASWHDSIYDIGAKDNEARSARAWRESRRAELQHEDYVREVADVIEGSANHWAASNEALPLKSKIFLDADLYELGASWEVFSDNTRRVVNEYTTRFALEEIIAGRLAWYRNVMEYPRIYWVATHLERKARLNIERAIKEMERGYSS